MAPSEVLIHCPSSEIFEPFRSRQRESRAWQGSAEDRRPPRDGASRIPHCVSRATRGSPAAGRASRDTRRALARLACSRAPYRGCRAGSRQQQDPGCRRALRAAGHAWGALHSGPDRRMQRPSGGFPEALERTRARSRETRAACPTASAGWRPWLPDPWQSGGCWAARSGDTRRRCMRVARGCAGTAHPVDGWHGRGRWMRARQAGVQSRQARQQGVSPYDVAVRSGER